MNAIACTLQDWHYRFFGGVVALLGGIERAQRSYALATTLGKLRTRFGYVGRGWSREKYLATIRAFFPQISDSEAQRLLEAYWINHQKRFMELFLTRELTPQNLDLLVKFEGLEYLDRALERGKGVILPVPHLGNERLHHITLAVQGYPVSVISSKYEDHGDYARQIKIEASQRFHEVGYPGDTNWLLKTLKRNRVLQVASTAEAKPQGVRIQFLGQQLLLPTGWARLALATGAPVLPSSLQRQADDRHLLIIKPEFELLHHTDRAEELRLNVQEYMNLVAKSYRNRPDLVDWMTLTVRLQETRKMKE